jgi:hypothetical protein
VDETGSGSCPEPATGRYPEPDASSSHLVTYFPKILSEVILPSTPRSSEWPLPLSFSEQNFVYTSHFFPCVLQVISCVDPFEPSGSATTEIWRQYESFLL